jgi:hypothetical protein
MKSLVSLVFVFTVLFLSPNWTDGQSIQLIERIAFDPVSELKMGHEKFPRAFCVTEDGIFLLPNPASGLVNAFGKNGKSLKFLESFGHKGFGKAPVFKWPQYCFYHRNKDKLVIFDDAKPRQLLIFDKLGMVNFELSETIPFDRSGYDMDFTGDLDPVVVISGFIKDEDGNPFDLYSRNLQTGQINYLLPSHERYGLKTFEEYVEKYRENQTIPAIGIRGFIDIEGDSLFFVWEGALRIIKINLLSKERMIFNQLPKPEEIPDYIKPDGDMLADSYKNEDFEKTWKDQETMSYVRNIFATPRHVFLIYETVRSNKNDSSRYRVQTYSPEGNFLSDDPIPENPDGGQMWFDKENYELYLFSKNANDEFSISQYRINR